MTRSSRRNKPSPSRGRPQPKGKGPRDATLPPDRAGSSSDVTSPAAATAAERLQAFRPPVVPQRPSVQAHALRQPQLAKVAPGQPSPKTLPARTLVATAAEPASEPDLTTGRPLLVKEVPSGPVQVTSWWCSAAAEVEPQGLGLTYWFDAAPTGAPYPLTVRFEGKRISPPDGAGPRDSFQMEQTLERVIPGSGRIALTARTAALPAGEWEVSAVPVVPAGGVGSVASGSGQPGALRRGSAAGKTMYLPVARVIAPGTRIGAWPTLVALGALVALAVQGLLAGSRQMPIGRLLVISLLASLIGLVGAKAYYLVTHRAERVNALTAGMSIQGFVLAALSTASVGSWWADIPIGPMLDVTAPALLFGMTIGRLGCFFGGCCAGRPTASRWGLWSSDRRVGVRRIPVQLMESATAALVAIGTLVAVLSVSPAIDGLILVAGLAAYIGARQLLFPLRGTPRKTTWGRRTTLVGAVMVLVSAVAIQVGASFL